MGLPFLAEVHPLTRQSIASTNRYIQKKQMISDFVKAIGFTSQANRSFSSAVEQWHNIASPMIAGSILAGTFHVFCCSRVVVVVVFIKRNRMQNADITLILPISILTYILYNICIIVYMLYRKQASVYNCQPTLTLL